MSFLSRLALRLFPRCCPLCGKLAETSDAAVLCEDCCLLFESELLTRCSACGQTAAFCSCLSREIAPLFTSISGQRSLSVAFYQPSRASAANRLLFRLKRLPDDGAARFLAFRLSRELLRLLLAEGLDPKDYLIAPIPRTKEAKAAYGFDQAERLARFVSEYTGILYRPLFTRKGGRTQKYLDRAGRQKNAESSLRLKKNTSLPGARVILCDDLITTGSTVAAAAKLARAAGATEVFALSAMKNPKK